MSWGWVGGSSSQATDGIACSLTKQSQGWECGSVSRVLSTVGSPEFSPQHLQKTKQTGQYVENKLGETPAVWEETPLVSHSGPQSWVSGLSPLPVRSSISTTLPQSTKSDRSHPGLVNCPLRANHSEREVLEWGGGSQNGEGDACTSLTLSHAGPGPRMGQERQAQARWSSSRHGPGRDSET